MCDTSNALIYSSLYTFVVLLFFSDLCTMIFYNVISILAPGGDTYTGFFNACDGDARQSGN